MFIVRETGQWVLGMWRRDSVWRRYVTPLWFFNGSLNRGGAGNVPSMSVMLNRLRPAHHHAEEVSRRIVEKAKREQADRDARREYRMSLAKHMRKKGAEEAAYILERGQVAISAEHERTEEVEDTVKRGLKSRGV